MTEAECSELLTYASIGDSRTVADETVEFWHRLIGKLEVSVATAAVDMHFAESKEYLMPVHVLANARRVKRAWDRDARIASSLARHAIAAPAITLDRAKFDAETEEALRAARIGRGLDPDTRKPEVVS